MTYLERLNNHLTKIAADNDAHDSYYTTAFDKNTARGTGSAIGSGLIGAAALGHGLKHGFNKWNAGIAGLGALSALGNAAWARHNRNNRARYDTDADYRRDVNSGKKEKIINFNKKIGIPQWMY